MENKHRIEEDRLYRQFQEQREREVQKVNHGLQEEWEVELEKLTSKFERELTKRKNSEDVKVLTIKHNKEKEEAKKNLTIKQFNNLTSFFIKNVKNIKFVFIQFNHLFSR